jgi:hypothetical protein
LPEPGQQQTEVRHRRRHAIAPEGVGAALERVGTPTLPDILHAARPHGTRHSSCATPAVQQRSDK